MLQSEALRDPSSSLPAPRRATSRATRRKWFRRGLMGGFFGLSILHPIFAVALGVSTGLGLVTWWTRMRAAPSSDPLLARAMIFQSLQLKVPPLVFAGICATALVGGTQAHLSMEIIVLLVLTSPFIGWGGLLAAQEVAAFLTHRRSGSLETQHPVSETIGSTDVMAMTGPVVHPDLRGASFPKLLLLSRHDDSNIALSACLRLYAINPREGIRALRYLSARPHLETAVRAIRALGRLGGADDLPILERLKRAHKRIADPTAEALDEAIHALSQPERGHLALVDEGGLSYSDSAQR